MACMYFSIHRYEKQVEEPHTSLCGYVYVRCGRVYYFMYMRIKRRELHVYKNNSQRIKKYVSSKPTQMYVIGTKVILYHCQLLTQTLIKLMHWNARYVYTSTRVYILKTLVCCDVIPLFQQPNISPVTVRF